jgi:hypothetical protein
MPFPLDYRGDVRWRGKTKLRGDQLQREVLHALATALRGAKGTVTVNGSTVSFTTERSHRFRQSNILLPIGHGELKVTLRDDTVVAEYTFNVQPLVAMASTLALGALAAVGRRRSHWRYVPAFLPSSG